jgi:hypothetical protein
MAKIKSVVIFAVLGFLISFFFGFFSGSPFFRIFLKALLFGGIFAILGFLITFVYDKFLRIDSVTENADLNKTDEDSAEQNKPILGRNVDITIKDEELEQSEDSNTYVVAGNRQMLTDSDIAKHNESEEENSSFVPIRFAETVENVSSVESKTLDETVRNEQDNSEKDVAMQNFAASQQDEGLDVLPDIEGISNDSSFFDATFVNKTDEESDRFSSSSYNSNDEKEVKDASLMAKAISSILSSET